jgi:hypothetical protein
MSVDSEEQPGAPDITNNRRVCELSTNELIVTISEERSNAIALSSNELDKSVQTMNNELVKTNLVETTEQKFSSLNPIKSNVTSLNREIAVRRQDSPPDQKMDDIDNMVCCYENTCLYDCLSNCLSECLYCVMCNKCSINCCECIVCDNLCSPCVCCMGSIYICCEKCFKCYNRKWCRCCYVQPNHSRERTTCKGYCGNCFNCRPCDNCVSYIMCNERCLPCALCIAGVYSCWECCLKCCKRDEDY